MSNPLSNFTIEELKKYANEIGYSFVKKPKQKVSLEVCPFCKTKPARFVSTMTGAVYYSCIQDDIAGEPSSVYMPFNDAVEGTIEVKVRTKAEADDIARHNWNAEVARIKREDANEG